MTDLVHQDSRVFSGELLDALLSHVQTAVIVHDRDLKIVRTNEAFHRMTGHGDEVLGKSPFEFVPEPLLSELGLKEKLLRVRDEGAVIGPEEIRYRTPDGRPVVFWHKAFPFRGADGAVAFAITLLQDLTEHAQAAQKLKEMVLQQETRLKEAADTRKAMLFMLEDLNASTAKIEQAKKEWEATFDAIADPLFIHDRAFRIVRANQAYADAAGMTPAELLGRPYYEVFPKTEGPFKKCLKAMEQVVRTEEEEEEQVLGQTPRKRYRTRLFSMQDSAGKYVHSIHVMEDITERKTMETHARRLEQLAAMGQLLGGISHEMKNPLFVLTGRLQLLKEKLAHREYDSLGSDLQKIEDAARRMTGIAQRFLTLARPTKPMLQSCSVQDTLEKVLDFLSNELMKYRIRVVREWEPALSKTQIWSDPQALHQIFLNLILNAMQAMTQAHGQGTLTVATAISNGWIEVRIQDDGPGIPPEHHANLFNPFFTTKAAGAGTGLGLWTVRVALMELKGQVTFETEVGRGTTFVVRLPLPHEPLPAGDRGPAEG